MSQPYGSCELAGSRVSRSSRSNAIAQRLMAASAVVLLSTIAVVALVSAADERVMLSTADVAADNLQKSGQLLDKVKGLLAQENTISQDVHTIETGPLLGPALADAPAPAPAPAPAAAPADPAPAAAAPVAAASGGAAPVAAASGAAVAASGGSVAAVAASSAAKRSHRPADAQNQRKDYNGAVGGRMSDAEDITLAPETSGQQPGPFDETKKARFILICVVFLGLCAGIYAAARSRHSGNSYSSVAPTYTQAYVPESEFVSGPASSVNVNSARQKLEAVQEQHAAARRQLQEQQQRLALAQQHLSQQEHA